ncbi:MAG: SDR family NAD(P)-dependent oxidoreductase [Luteolibacter sp.]
MPGSMVVTGGTGDLGQVIAREFQIAGWEVVSPGRVDLDVTSPDSVAAFFKDRETDLLVCNAGLTRDVPLAKLSESDWDAVMQANLHGAARCAKAALRGMVKRRTGHIVFISSFSALHPPVGQAAYAAAKAGLIGLAKSLAREVGRAGVRINAVLPGFLETRMTAGVSPERRTEGTGGAHPRALQYSGDRRPVHPHVG